MAFWLDGWAMPRGNAAATSRDLILATGHRLSPETFANGLRYLFYFGLTTAACRWWVSTDRKRKDRVRVFPVVAAGFWAVVFMFLWPTDSTPLMVGIAPLIIAAVAVQAASAWAGPPIPIAYLARQRSRNRHAYA
jgi:eukaryotic-like serine/threonine-protein kinase